MIKISNYYSNFLNASIVNPASLTIPAIVNSLIGFARGIMMMLLSLVIEICLPCRMILYPVFERRESPSAEIFLDFTRLLPPIGFLYPVRDRPQWPGMFQWRLYYFPEIPLRLCPATNNRGGRDTKPHILLRFFPIELYKTWWLTSIHSE